MNSVSIITPAYKAEDTIARAVSSVIAQTHSDWEMIIISDDGQDYQAILARHNIVDSRLRFASTQQVGAGPSRGRNIGLDMAKGEFITMLDADDEYHPDYVKILVKAASKYGVAMVLLTHKTKQGRDKTPFFTTTTSINPEAEYSEVNLDGYIGINGSTVTLFARTLLRHRYLESICYSEDFFFDLHFFQSVDIVPIFHERYYIYHHNDASLTSTPRCDERFIEDYKSVITWIEADSTLTPRIRNAFLAFYHYRLFQNYMYLNAKAQGKCTDFFDFMAKFPEHFRWLKSTPSALPANGAS